MNANSSHLNMNIKDQLDKVEEYKEKMKQDYLIRATENNKILQKLGFNIEQDLPIIVDKYFNHLCENEINYSDYATVLLDQLETNKAIKEVKRKINSVHSLCQEFQKEEINLKRQVEKAQKVMEAMQDEANECEIKYLKLQSKRQNQVEDKDKLFNIASNYENIQDLEKRKQEIKEKILETTSKLQKYRELPPDLDEAKEKIEITKKMAEDLDNKMKILVSSTK
uniref:Uncharacterized protein n=3 Tax=Clastoptera arizonana TaxID=38151 RepID=A0A1B6C9I3_9HEMI